MKQILAAILSALLFVQPVFAMPVREPVLYADVQGEAEDNDDTQKNANTQELSLIHISEPTRPY